MAGQKNNKKYNVVDLFAGVGGLSVGFLKAGFNVISANEHDHNIAYTYEKNHPETKVIVKDIADVKSSDFLINKNDNVDVVVGGPPCQGFSMAGRRIRNNGEFLNDPRNELFKEFYRIVKELKPKIFVMENVAALLTMHDGNVKNEILKLFNNLGYQVEVKVLLAADYGIPQLRKRAVFIGNNININPDDLFPLKTHGSETGNEHITISESIFDLPFINAGEGDFESKYDKRPETDYQKERRKKSKKLFNHISSFHNKKIIDILKLINEGQGRSDLPEKYKTKSIHSGSYGRLDKNKPAYTITTRFDTPSVGRVTHPILHRSLTPREAARIQSFDDDFVFYGNKGSIGKQIGNAVPPLLAHAVAKRIKKFI
jgi:DNA (cytosine-5)-methyltransferase 1